MMKLPFSSKSRKPEPVGEAEPAEPKSAAGTDPAAAGPQADRSNARLSAGGKDAWEQPGVADPDEPPALADAHDADPDLPDEIAAEEPEEGGKAGKRKAKGLKIRRKRRVTEGDRAISVLVLVVGLCTALATAGLVFYQAERLFDANMRSDAVERAEFLAGRLAGTPLGRGDLPAEKQAALSNVLSMDDVFRIELRGADGRELQALSGEGGSAEPARIDPATTDAYLGRRAAAEPLWQSFKTDGVRLPGLYSETVVPIAGEGGEPAGFLSLFVDHTPERDLFWQWLTGILGVILAMAIVGFSIPAVSLFLRTKQKRDVFERLTYVSDHDTLTALSNREQFMQTLEGEIRRHSEQGQRLALHYVDIDRFKEINDTHGHVAGDEFLKQVAERLRDLVDKPEHVARLGGDEFAVIQTQAGGVKYAEIHGRRIGSVLNGLYRLGEEGVVASASIGIAVSPEHGDCAVDLLKNADLALNKVKAGGRNDVAVFTSELTSSMQGRLEMQAILRRAFRERWFVLYFQPQYNLATRRLTGFEALLRLKHPERGVVSPAEFIPVAEETGLIEPLGEWIMREACRTASLWPENLTLAVNLSPAQFKKGNLPNLIKTTLKASGMKAERLEVEITEGLLLESSNRVLSQLREIKKLGVGLIMDDFGTGYSSLSYLWRFAFDGIKIDRSFVHGVGAGRHVERLLRSIVMLGNSLNLKVTAEGVESAEQAHFLVTNECAHVQGFLFGWPVPKEEVPMVIAKDIRVGTREAQKRSRAAGDETPAEAPAETKEPARKTRAA